ncbi:hypothetical protein ACSX1A_05120 [Pontibacter sp. MBLB2868]|uniref:hypothetical protein n=1 Tax=Pontibacter sp. MBLB2868 TaxID=3451555 RepID=UPI003F756493
MIVLKGITAFLCCVIIPGILLNNKLYTLLAVLLCCALGFCFPIATQAATPPSQNIIQSSDNDEMAPFAVAPDEDAAVDVDAILQLKKNSLVPFFQTVLGYLYPPQQVKNVMPGEAPFSKGDCGRHSCLTKGP